MGNYKNIETEFVERTLKVLSQYESIVHKYKFEEQYNYTLLFNCLLGLVVLPKELSLTYIPKTIIDSKSKKEMGLIYSEISPEYKDLQSLIIAIRHSISHFNFEIESENDDYLIDRIVFNIDSNQSLITIAKFQATELLPFMRYYATSYLSNFKMYKK